MLRFILVGLVCALAGGVGGFMMGNLLVPASSKEPVVAGASQKAQAWQMETLSGEERITPEKALNRLVVRLRSDMPYTEWENFLTIIEKDLKKGEESDALLLLLTRWLEQSPSEAMGKAREWGLNSCFLVKLLLHWATFDKDAAMRYFEEHREALGEQAYKYGMETLAHRLLKSEPEDSWNLLRKEGGDLKGFFTALGGSHPDRMAAFVSKLGIREISERAGLLPEIVEAWAGVDKVALIRWLDSLPEQDKEKGRIVLLAKLAQEDRELARSLLKRWREEFSREAEARLSEQLGGTSHE